jgi:formylglycine-generating enzyme required for sulfatase activity
MVEQGSCCIDRYEAFLVERIGNDARVHPHNERPPAARRYEARSERGAYPQAYISRDEAAHACEASGKRLCTAREWYSACSAGDGRTYPYGRRYVAGACNVGKPHLLTRFYGPDPRAWRYEENFNDPRLDIQPGFLAKSGEHPDCVSASGAHDMVGNLHEWVSDRVDRALPIHFPLAPALLKTVRRNTGHGVFLGGFFSTSHEHGYGCRFATLAHEPAYHDYSTGFRCCRDLGMVASSNGGPAP